MAQGPGAVQPAHFVDTPQTRPARAVQQVSYSAGQSTGALKWLPANGAEKKPNASPASDSTQQVQFAAPIGQPGAMPADDPMVNPFGDRSAVPLPAPGSGKLDDAVLEKPPALLPSADTPPIKSPQTPLQGESVEQSQPVPPQELERQLAAAPRQAADECLPPEKLKKISELSYKIAAEEGKFPTECTLISSPFQPRCWAPVTYHWTASSLCHKPLYFEEVGLERYGHSWGPYLQPVVSGAHFFLTVPILPYKMGLYPPGECMYTLGYYRPGSCAPPLLDPIPISVRAAVLEMGVWTGMMFLIP